MITSIEAEREVINALVDLWNSEVRPHVTTNACILSARITSEVLKSFNIEHAVFSMAVMAMNDEMLHNQQNEVLHTAWSPTAWSVGVGFGQMIATNKDSRDGTGFDGHVIVVTDNHYIDLTAYQFDRLEHHIDTNGPLIVPMADVIHPYTLTPNSPNQWIYVPIQEGHLVMAPNKNEDFYNSPDWQIHYQRQTDDIIRQIRARISS